MRIFEYKSPDDRVLVNEETLSYGSIIYSRRRLNLYLVDKTVGEAIQQYSSVDDKSKIPMFMDKDGIHIDLNNPVEYLKHNYICNCDDIIVNEKIIDATNSNKEQS